MSILSGIPVLHCHLIDVTLDFYQQALQFVIVKKRESEDSLQWVHLMNGSTTIMLQRVQSQPSKQQNSKQPNILLYFYVSDIKEISHFLKLKYNIDANISLTKYRMYECDIYDPEGNKITLGQKVDGQPEEAHSDKSSLSNNNK